MKIDSIKKTITPILKKYNIKKSALFGSAVRGEMKKESDIDLLVELPKNVHGFDYISLRLALQEDLEKKLKRKVDLVEFDYIKPSLRKYILQTKKPIILK